jgi:DNA polymerase-3 subunit epsilon
VEIAVVKVHPDGHEDVFQSLVNPEMPIPQGATDVHGITNAKVKNQPTFKALSKKLAKMLDDCDFAGFRVWQFDLPLLRTEFERVGVELETEDRHVVDAHIIYQEKERRDLTAAMKFYCDSDHDGAHSALQDVRATQKVLAAQVTHYDDLPCSAEELSGYCKEARPQRFADSGYWFARENGELVLNKTENKGQLLADVAKSNPGLLRWILGKDFPADTKKIALKALQGAGQE